MKQYIMCLLLASTSIAMSMESQEGVVVDSDLQRDRQILLMILRREKMWTEDLSMDTLFPILNPLAMQEIDAGLRRSSPWLNQEYKRIRLAGWDNPRLPKIASSFCKK